MTTDLYTQTDIKKTRDILLNDQKGLCLITKEPVVKPCLDHAHDDTQLVRGVLSHGINIFLGQIENAYKRRVSWWCDIPLADLLLNVSEYLSTDNKKASEYRHPAWTKKVQTSFNKLSEGQKGKFLSLCDLPDGKNGAERKRLFQDILKSRQYSFADITKKLQEVQ